MGYRTPNIDRIADEGMRFTDSYGEQSCTAGRSSFITGQSVYRTGLSKVGIPGADIGLQAEDPTIAELLKPLGYATGQFGKNHLGDKNEFLPTVHGFDEFFGNLYHLNAEEEPELPELPAGRRLPELPRPLRAARRHPLVGDRGGRPDRAGPLRPRRPAADRGHRAADDASGWRRSTTRCSPRATDFIDRQHAAEAPFFVWFNTTHMHFRTHPKPESVGPGRALAVALPRHDDRPRPGRRRRCSTSSTRSGLAEDTIVIYSTDNGPHMNSWPDGGMTPFRSEKNTNWEGAFRVPQMIRWPARIAAGRRSRTRSSSHHDWLPTLPRRRRRAGHRREAQGRPRRRRHGVQGPHRRLQPAPYLTGEADASPRPGFVYFSDDGDLLGAALRQLEGRLHGAARCGARCRCGRSRSCRCASPSCSTCARTRSSAPTPRRTRTTTGSSTTPTSSWPPRPSSRSSSRRSRSSRRARRRRASRSTRRSSKLEAAITAGPVTAVPSRCRPGTPAARGRRSSTSSPPRSPTRGARGARRRLRQRRHAVVREADADRARLHPRAPGGDGRRRTPRCRSASRGRPPTSTTTAGWAAPSRSTTTATTTT